mgnify:CR=1 FL=1
MEERLQKILSAAGVCSRRTAEEHIAAGRVTVNGITAVLGTRADPVRDHIALDGHPVGGPAHPVYLMLNKPRGYVTTLSDEKGRKTVAELVSGCGRRVWPVGRLDLDSEGLLLLTDDGELTQKLLHPSHQVEKEYLVWVTGDVSRGLPVLSGPMDLDGVPLSPAKVRRGRTSGGVTQLSITICQGKNRQVRRMCGQAGLKVLRLKRVREGGLCLDRTLGPGKWRRLEQSEVAALLQKP